MLCNSALAYDLTGDDDDDGWGGGGGNGGWGAHHGCASWASSGVADEGGVRGGVDVVFATSHKEKKMYLFIY